MVEENFEFRYPEIRQNERIQMIYLWSSFTMVEENFEIRYPEIRQIERIQMIFLWSSFTVVEVKFEIWSFQMAQIYSKVSDFFTVIERKYSVFPNTSNWLSK